MAEAPSVPQAHKFNAFVFPLQFIGAEKNAFNGLVDALKITKPMPPDMSRVVPKLSLKANIHQVP